jgi:hypothetical protein
MRTKAILICINLLIFSRLYTQNSDYFIQQVGGPFSLPVSIASNPWDKADSILYIVEKAGRIQRVKYSMSGDHTSTLFLDIRTKVGATGNEQGLLGLAFDPRPSNRDFFYVYYTDKTGTTVVSRFTRNRPDTLTSSISSESIIITQTQPFSNHNGGAIEFGPDNMLYISLGDGGSAGDPQNNSQNNNTLLGKILRLDVSNLPATIPSDNPFVGALSARNEIWMTGLRNVWKFSFDRKEGDMWQADVGQNIWEEINFIPKGQGKGWNFGWRCYEGNSPYNTQGCSVIGNYKFPIYQYGHTGAGCGGSVTGGYVYRGGNIDSLEGKYICADYCTGNLYVLSRNGSSVRSKIDAGFVTSPLAFGENNKGELFVSSANGNIYQFRGKSSTSTKEISINSWMKILSNPSSFNEPLSLEIVNAPTDKINLSVFSSDGRLIQKYPELNDSGRNLELPLNTNPGLYFLVVGYTHDGKLRTESIPFVRN